MPTLIHKSEVRIEWTDILNRTKHRRPKNADIRSSGVHLSGVIKYVLTTSGLLNAEDQTDEMPLRMAVGMAWEDWAVGLWKDMVWQPGEMELDGVFATPDGRGEMDWPGLSNPKAGWPVGTIEEFKATWKSEHTHGKVTDERIWMWQLAGNLKMAGLNYARLHVLWVNGNYRPPAPVYMTYGLFFTQDELDKFWQNVVLKNKDKAKAERH